jgi:glucose/arabinose dehydrogenase
VELLHVVRGALVPVWSAPLKRVRKARFTHGGHRFVCADATHAVHVYGTYTRELIALLRGHNHQIRGISFSPDDQLMVSTGDCGSVYFWDMRVCRRIPARAAAPRDACRRRRSASSRVAEREAGGAAPRAPRTLARALRSSPASDP